MGNSRTVAFYRLFSSLSRSVSICEKINIPSSRALNPRWNYFFRKYSCLDFKTETSKRSICLPSRRHYSNTVLKRGSSQRGNDPINKEQAEELVLRLTEQERANLLTALQEFESNQIKAEYEGQLAANRWRSRFGRPSKLPTLGNVDPTGTYCRLSDDWLKKKYAENVPPPTLNQLLNVAVHNAVPFIGFGFLDNFIMIIAGDYIEIQLGAVITISTMAAAALGNTISDVLGIGSAWYVEQLASKIGLKAPNLSPIQLDMSSARAFANMGRAVGIVIGCLLGMIPLLFMNPKNENSDEKIEKT